MASSRRILQMRLVVEADDYEDAVRWAYGLVPTELLSGLATMTVGRRSVWPRTS
jgi:hypothetical protein